MNGIKAQRVKNYQKEKNNMGKIAFRADQYYNNKNKIDAMFGDAACAVDLNAGLVVEKSGKYGMCEGCGDYTEDNIQERFGLETPNDEEDSYGK